MTHLVLLHGWGATGDVWRRQVGVFAETCTVHAPDIPRWETAWVAGYVTRLPLEQTVLLGWSLGGMLLLEALAETQAQPAGLILVGVPAMFCRRKDHPSGQSPAAVRAMRQALKKDARQVLQDFAGACLAPGEERFRYEVTDLFRADTDAAKLVAGLDYLLTADLRPLLPRLPVRPIIVQGEADRIVAPGQARFLSEHLPGSRLEMLSEAGHAPFITQVADFNKIVREIVGEGGTRFPRLPPKPLPAP